MNSDLLTVGVLPDHLFLRGDFEQFGSMPVRAASRVARYDDVSVGQNLAAAWILQPVAREVVVGQRPDDFSFGIEVDDSIAVSAADECVSVSVADCGEWPRVDFVIGVACGSCVQLSEDLSFARIMIDGKVQQMRRQVSAVGELASHPSLHVMVLFLTGQREFQNYITGHADFEQSGIVACFRDDEGAVGCRLGTVDLTLSSLPDE